MTRWIAFAAMVLCLSAGPLAAQQEAYTQKRAELEPGDHEGLFELGMWCLGRGGPMERYARACFEDLLDAPGDVRDRATYRLALWHLNRGRGFADAKLGVDLLARVASRGAEIPAGRDLGFRRETVAARKRDLIEKAQRALVAGNVESAARILNEARRLPFGKASGEYDLDDARILDNIARALAEAERAWKKFADPKLPVDCPKCNGTGFQKCPKCKGKGEIRVKTDPKRVLTPEGFKYEPGKWVTRKCAHCGGSGKIPCKACRATGVDFDLLPKGRKRDWYRFGMWIESNAEREDPILAVERVFQEVVDHQLKVPASLDASIRFPLIPPTREKMDVASLKRYWEQATPKDKLDFLRSITILSARWMEPFFFQARSRQTLGVKEPFADRPRLVPLPPEIVGSDPVAFQNRWVSVIGEIQGKNLRGFWPEDVSWIQLRGRQGSHNLQILVWKPAAREKHRILSEMHRDFGYLRRFLWTYPFTLEEQIDKLRSGTKVVLYGRTIFESGGYPSHALEVWSVDPVSDRRGLKAPDGPPPDPEAFSDLSARAACLHQKAMDTLRRAGDDEDARETARGAALACLRDAIDLYQRAMVSDPDDGVLQESHAETLHALHAILRGEDWPR